MRLKDITILSPQYIERGVEDNVSFVPMESLRNGNIEYKTIPINQAKGKYTYFGNGDLLVAKVTPCFENGNIAIANNLLNGIGFGSSEIFVLRPSKRIISQYLFYLSQSGDFQGKACATMCGVGGLKRISPLFMRTYELDVPSLKTQQRIITYLDTKLSEISHQVSLLTSKRDAYLRLKKSIINHAVTHGLNPNVKMKDSGIEWIGEVPEHWELGRVKDHSNIVAGQAPAGEDVKEYGLIPFMQGKAEFTDKFPITKLFCETCTKHSRVGDILMSVRAPIGDINISDRIYGIGRGLCAIKSHNIDATFLWYFFMKSKDYINSLGTGSTFLAITTEDIKGIPIPIPPLPEQHAIATYLDDKCSKIDAIVSNLDKQISRYGDLKRALIDEVITGKRAV